MKYTITQSPSPLVTCTLGEKEQLVTESGLSGWVSANVAVKTSRDMRLRKKSIRKIQKKNLLGRLHKSTAACSQMAGRLLSGSALLHNIYTAQQGEGTVAFASDYYDAVVFPLMIDKNNGYLIGKGGFLGAEKRVHLSCCFNGVCNGLGGEGIFLQRLTGRGIAFIQTEGSVQKHVLGEKEQIIVNPGLLVAMSDSCTLSVKRNRNLRNVLLGSQNLFLTVITGPGTVYLNM